jgi:hypothetical protein
MKSHHLRYIIYLWVAVGFASSKLISAKPVSPASVLPDSSESKSQENQDVPERLLWGYNLSDKEICYNDICRCGRLEKGASKKLECKKGDYCHIDEDTVGGCYGSIKFNQKCTDKRGCYILEKQPVMLIDFRERKHPFSALKCNIDEYAVKLPDSSSGCFLPKPCQGQGCVCFSTSYFTYKVTVVDDKDDGDGGEDMLEALIMVIPTISRKEMETTQHKFSSECGADSACFLEIPNKKVPDKPEIKCSSKTIKPTEKCDEQVGCYCEQTSKDKLMTFQKHISPGNTCIYEDNGKTESLKDEKVLEENEVCNLELCFCQQDLKRNPLDHEKCENGYKCSVNHENVKTCTIEMKTDDFCQYSGGCICFPPGTTNTEVLYKTDPNSYAKCENTQVCLYESERPKCADVVPRWKTFTDKETRYCAAEKKKDGKLVGTYCRRNEICVPKDEGVICVLKKPYRFDQKASPCLRPEGCNCHPFEKQQRPKMFGYAGEFYSNILPQYLITCPYLHSCMFRTNGDNEIKEHQTYCEFQGNKIKLTKTQKCLTKKQGCTCMVKAKEAHCQFGYTCTKNNDKPQCTLVRKPKVGEKAEEEKTEEEKKKDQVVGVCMDCLHTFACSVDFYNEKELRNFKFERGPNGASVEKNCHDNYLYVSDDEILKTFEEYSKISKFVKRNVSG